MSHLTREDLEVYTNHLKEHIDLRVGYVSKRVDGMHETLYGENGRSGITRDVTRIKTTAGVLKWLAGISGMSAAASWAAKVLH